MRVLVICQYYFPEPFRITDICEELVKRGHEVTVVTGLPNYPMGVIYPEYRFGQKREELVNGVKVHRCFTIGRKNGALRRILNYYSFMFSSSIYISRLEEKYDVVFVNQLSPVIMAEAGIKYKKRHNVKLVLYCLDLWPESLVAGGINRGSVIFKYFHHVSKKIYSQADKVFVASKSFTKFFEDEFNIGDTEYLPQYAESLFTPQICKKEPDENIDLMFAGNVGAAQSVDTIVKAAILTKDIRNLRWHIVGDGSELVKLKKMAEKLDNIIFHGRKPLDEMPRYYAIADAMLVTMQKDPILSLTLPGKVQTYMAAGKPIIGAIGGETQLVIDEAECGYCCGAEDQEGLARKVVDFMSFKNIGMLGDNALHYYDNHYSISTFLNILEASLTEKNVSDKSN